MPKSTPETPSRRPAAFVALAFEDGPAAPPKQRQLYDQIRAHVLSGRLAAGMRLPATRGLAGELGCSRNTVLSAYEQLLAEGYLTGAHGSGTYVSQVLPDQFLAVGARAAASLDDAGPGLPRPALSRRGQALARPQIQARGPRDAFMLGPDTARFPFEVWGRMLGRTWRRPRIDLLGYGDPAGYRPLREAIAEYVRSARGLRCEWRQILITSGVQQALDLVVRALLDPGDAVWCEDPGYRGFRGPLSAAGARVAAVPVDGEGLSVTAGRARAPEARLAVVAPSHQFPLGVVMTLGRRLELLDWARTAKAWILEDDYDSEYRYAGRPLAALQGLDAARGTDGHGTARGGGGRVIYAGSFSKVMFPSLRIGYLIAPEDLIAPLTRVRAALEDHPSSVIQPALAAFIAEGHFAGHVRRMRAHYAARQEALLSAARRHLDGLLDVAPDEAGMHLVARFSPVLAACLSDTEAETRAWAAGITVSALSNYAIEKPTAPGLLLGYAAVPEARLLDAARSLAKTLEA